MSVATTIKVIGKLIIKNDIYINTSFLAPVAVAVTELYNPYLEQKLVMHSIITPFFR